MTAGVILPWVVALFAGLATALIGALIANRFAESPKVIVAIAILSFVGGIGISARLYPPLSVAVPDITGHYKDVAKEILVKEGLVYGEEKTQYDDRIKALKIISQDPEGGALVSKNTVVNVVVSKGPRPLVVVPSVIGRARTEAVKILKAQKLRPVFKSEEYSEEPKGIVVSQKPEPGAEVSAGARIVLKISKGGKPPLDVTAYFYPSGWMGDGEQGVLYLKLNTGSRDTFHSPPTSIKVIYQPGPKGWAGIFWQYPDSNWGNKPGRNLKGYSRLIFWARSKNGGDVVEFKAGGIIDTSKTYQDSFEKSLGKITLTSGWEEYEIDLTGEDLSSVIGAFAWVVTKDDNPEGITFYLDDIHYE